jgi:Tfp pilus assembly protein PilV
MMRTAPAIAARHGISLLEVLISMGILTVGLLSVLALVPAGKSQAVKAVIYDRSTVMASNVAADLISRGLLRPTSWAATVSTPIAVFDPLYNGSQSWPPAGSAISMKSDAATTGASAALYLGAGLSEQTDEMRAVCDVLFRSEDDPLYTLDGVGPDDPPLPRLSAGSAATPGGRRSFEGLYSFLATLQTSAIGAPYWSPSTPATLTIVTFQRRDPASAPIVFTPDGQTATDGGWTYNPSALPSGQKIKDLVRPGTMVLWLNNATSPTAVRWHRVVLAAEQQVGRVAFTCEGTDPGSSAGTVLVFPGAVGGLEIPVKLEGTSSWNR